MQILAAKYNPAFLNDDVLVRSFVVRHVELSLILETVRENTGDSNQHILVVGPRGIGKTTIALRVAAEIRAKEDLYTKWYPIVYSEESYNVTSPGEFWLEALFHLGEQTGSPRWKSAYEELRNEGDENRLRERSLAQLMDCSDAQGQRLLFVVENLNMIIGSQMSSDDAWILRHTLMNEPRVMLLSTATTRFKEVEEYDQSLYDLFKVVELDPFDNKESQELWRSTSGKAPTIEQMRPIQILTGGNPRLIHIISRFAAQSSFQELTTNLVRLIDEHTEYFKYHLDNLPPQERKVFVVLADLWDPSIARKVANIVRFDVNKTSALLNRLIERGAVAVIDQRGRTKYYQVAERMYNIYHLMRRRGRASNRVRAVVQFMVHFYKGEDLVRTTASIIKEACALPPDKRKLHFDAFEMILTETAESEVKSRIIAETKHLFREMHDTPSSTRELISALQFEKTEQKSIIIENTKLTDDEKDILLKLSLANANGIDRLTGGVLCEHPELLEKVDAAYRKALEFEPKNPEIWKSFGWFLHSQQRFEEAIDAFNRALEIKPDNALAWFHKGMTLGKLGRHEEALDAFNRAIEIKPDNAITWSLKGIALGSLKRYDEAVTALDQSLEIEPNGAFAWRFKGVALSDLNRYEESLGAFDRSLEIKPNDASTWSFKGIALLKLERYEQALDAFSRSLEIESDNALAWRYKGIALRILERFEEAIDAFNRSLEIEPNDALAWYYKGIALGNLERHEEALDAFNRSIEIRPDDALARRYKGVALRILERFEEAIDAFNRALEIEPNDALAWYYKGIALGNLERHEEALDAFNRSIEIKPDDSYTWRNKGVALLSLQRYEETIDAFGQSLEIEPDNAVASCYKGVALLNLERHEEALDAFDRALEIKPDDADTRNYKGVVLFSLGRHEEALDVLNGAMDIQADNASILHSYTQVLSDLRSENIRFKAEALFRLAVEKNPKNGVYEFALATILICQDEWSEALEHTAIFLNDTEMVTSCLDNVIDFFVKTASAGYAAESSKLIETSPSAETLETMSVALQLYTGSKVDVALEIREVAEDVVKRIESRREASQNRKRN